MKKIFSLALALATVVLAHAASYTLTMGDYAATSFTAGNFSLTANKADAANDPAYNATSLDIRVYAGGTVVITCPDVVSELVFHLSAQGVKRQAAISASTGKVSQTAGADALTWTGSATSLTLTVGAKADFGTETAKAGQFDFTSIDVTTGGEAPDPDEPVTPPSGDEVAINGLAYADAYLFSYDGYDYLALDLYKDYDYDAYEMTYPEVYLEMEALSLTSIAGDYDLLYGGYWKSANDSVESDLESEYYVGSLQITYDGSLYTLKGSFEGTDGKTYTFACTPDLVAYDGDYNEIELKEDGAPQTGIEYTVDSEEAQKVVRNGQLIIRRHGVSYTATGQQTR